MAGIDRNGIAGLAVRAALIALAVLMFGSASRAAAPEAGAQAPAVIAAR